MSAVFVAVAVFVVGLGSSGPRLSAFVQAFPYTVDGELSAFSDVNSRLATHDQFQSFRPALHLGFTTYSVTAQLAVTVAQQFYSALVNEGGSAGICNATLPQDKATDPQQTNGTSGTTYVPRNNLMTNNSIADEQANATLVCTEKTAPEIESGKTPTTSFHGFVGQVKIVHRLKSYCTGAKAKNTPLLHLLFIGPTGSGKSMLAKATAAEMKTDYRTVFASSGTTRYGLIELARTLKKSDLLFIDEVHALGGECQELLYAFMDGRRAPKIDTERKRIVENEWEELQEFTVIAATDRPGEVRQPLVARMQRICFVAYRLDELRQIALNHASKLGMLLTKQAATLIAEAARGNPRQTRKLLDSLHASAKDTSQEVSKGTVNTHLASVLDIDTHNLDGDDRRYLISLRNQGSLSLANLTVLVSRDADTLQREVEPFLIKLGFLTIGGHGRRLTPTGLALAKELAQS